MNSNPGPSDLLPARLDDDRDDPDDEEAAGLRQVELLERPTERGDLGRDDDGEPPPRSSEMVLNEVPRCIDVGRGRVTFPDEGRFVAGAVDERSSEVWIFGDDWERIRRDENDDDEGREDEGCSSDSSFERGRADVATEGDDPLEEKDDWS